MKSKLQTIYMKIIALRHGAKIRVVLSLCTVLPIAAFCMYGIIASPYQSVNNTDQLIESTQQKEHSAYVRAEVLSVSLNKSGDQTLHVKILDGESKRATADVSRYGYKNGDKYFRNIPIGSKVILLEQDNNYTFIDRYKVPGGLFLVLFLLMLVIIIGRWRGITALAGLSISIGIIFLFIIPRISEGHNALLASTQGAMLIATASIFIAHGFNKRTAVSFGAAIATLIMTVGITLFSIHLTGLNGVTNEDILYFNFNELHLSIGDMLFGGIIIASLGVLNDITIGQAASVDELYKAQPKQTFRELYSRGMSVGREHIAALVNTLALAYAGVALPSMVLLSIYNNAPFLIVLNSETIMEEIVRTAVASISILLAVPLTTALAAYILPRWYQKH